jgi:1,4-dihydroxy-2-naphthoyl-CoA hydrolase
MLRPDVNIESIHAGQAGTLPDKFGARVTEIQEGRMHMQLQIEPWMMAPNGFLHAASIILLADTCCGYATFAHLPQGAKGFTTVELKSNFLGTATSGLMVTEAIAEHMGRTTHVWSATVSNAQGRKMALFRCTQMILW